MSSTCMKANLYPMIVMNNKTAIIRWKPNKRAPPQKKNNTFRRAQILITRLSLVKGPLDQFRSIGLSSTAISLKNMRPTGNGNTNTNKNVAHTKPMENGTSPAPSSAKTNPRNKMPMVDEAGRVSNGDL